jgi:hypothetical protein
MPDSLQDKAEQAIVANNEDIATINAFLAIQVPTNPQNAQAIKDLARMMRTHAKQLNNVARLVMGTHSDNVE